MSEKIKIFDKSFHLCISNKIIVEKVQNVAAKINNDYNNENVIFIGVLNGAFMFASELLKYINFQCEVSFVKVASYQGDSSTGTVKRLIGINEDLKDKTVIVVEDIVDSGITAENIMKQLKGYEPAEIRIASMFFKPQSFTKKFKIDYLGMEIPDDFIVGFGLDYMGLGRNLINIYKSTE